MPVLSYARICRAPRLAGPARPVFDAPNVNSATPSSKLPNAPSASPPGAPRLVLGIGCRRGVTLAQIEAAVHTALDGASLADVAAVATLDAKAGEPALRAFCAAHGLPLRPYGRDEIAAVTLQAAPSAAAQAQFGVAGVCEPCARLAADGGPLVRGKLALGGVTVAVALLAR